MIKVNLLPPGMRAAQQAQTAAKAAAPAKPAVAAAAAKQAVSAGLGITAMRLLLFGVGTVVALLILIFAGVVAVPYWLARGEVSVARSQWTPLEAEFTRLDALNAQVAKDSVVLEELSPQIAGRLRWAKILNAVSDVVPSSVQLLTLSTLIAKEMIPSPPPPPDPKAKAPAADKKAAPPPSPPMVEGTVQVLNLEGVVAKGKLGEDDIKILLDQIRSHPVFKEYFDSANLTDVASMPDQTKKFSIKCRFKIPGKTA